MKKTLLFMAMALATATTASAQVEDFSRAGHFATEVQFNPFSNDFNTFKMSELKFRYFINDDNALRFSVGFGYDKQQNTNVDYFNNQVTPATVSYTNSTAETKTEDSKMQLKAAIGYEYHLNLLDRLSVYLGGEVGYEAKFFKGKKTIDTHSYSNSSNTNTWNDYSTSPAVQKSYTRLENTTFDKHETYDYKKQTSNGANRDQNALFCNIFTGIDFQLYRGLYIGTELGISLKMGKILNGTNTYDMTSTRVQDIRYSGDQPSYAKNENEIITTNAYEKFSSETGIREYKSVTTSTIASHNGNQPTDPTYTANNYYDNSSKFTNIELYIQPALRIGWRF